jgi:hypothetical protein
MAGAEDYAMRRRAERIRSSDSRRVEQVRSGEPLELSIAMMPHWPPFNEEL